MDRFLLFFCIQILFYSSCIAEQDALVVNTANGVLRGRLQDVINGVSIRQFLGIPYAQPPIGELRFARPKPAESWQDVRDAGEFGPMCPQVPIEEMFKAMNVSVDSGEEIPQSEDCLSLNVYTPSKTTPTDKLAVMVWIHGGAFTMGTGRTYNPSLLVALHNVIVVTINYRLGVLGFFNIPGTDVKGNYGSYDQILSLKWVQQNIAAFGGNPDQVTIFGESAGGMSVSSHLVSPLSKGLFHRVIAQSGSSVGMFSCSRVTSTKGLEVFSKAISCDGKDDKLLDCLKKKSFKDIIAGQTNLTMTMMIDSGPEFLTKPIVDGEFLPDDPRTLFKNGQVNKADVMLGTTADEGSFMVWFFTGIAHQPLTEEMLRNTVRQFVLMSGFHSQLSEDAVMREYLDRSDLNNADKIRRSAIDFFSDSLFVAAAVDEANLLAKADIPVYMYVMDHHLHAPRLPAWMGAYHGVDLCYTFGLPLKKDMIGMDLGLFAPGNYSALEEGFAKYAMQMWTNFAKYGDPNGADHMPVTWPQYNHEHAHLRLSTQPKLQRGLRERQVEFWTEFFPKLTEHQRTKSQSEASGTKAKEGKKQKEEL